MKWTITIVTAWMMFGAASGVRAQGYVDQEAVAPILESQGHSGGTVAPVKWHRFTFSKSDKTSKAALNRLKAHLDALPGGMREHRMEIVELSNRVRGKYMIQRHTLLVPDHFADDYRAYAPFPQKYTAAAELQKLFIIDKYTQTFGAYENGHLVRWGLISSGADDQETPGGRFSFNWRQEYRESSEALEGEVWKMRWVFNFNALKGIHVHQYQLPIATPASHGCVRLSESDAVWNYNWAEQWVMQNERLQQAGTPVIVINHNPAGLAAHWLYDAAQGAVSLVSLPQDPMSLPLGTKSQEVAGP